jgi:uncharacterized protein YndB with AHSA1/START domain
MLRTFRTTAAVALAVVASGAALTAGAASAATERHPAGPDTSAPVLSHHFIDIEAPRATVWRLFTNVKGWTTWQPHITAAHLSSRHFRPGGSFTWTSEGFTVTSHILAARHESRVVWTGTAQGITGTHEWLFRDTPGGTRVITTESFSGGPVEADVDGMQSILDTSLPYWLQQLKTRAEMSA